VAGDSPDSSPGAGRPGKRGRRESAPAGEEARPAKRSRTASESSAGSSKKRGRGRPLGAVREEEAVREKLVCKAADRGAGQVFCVGQGDTGQLGLGDDVMERSRPALVAAVGQAVEVVAGGMHTVALDIHGKVWTWGCNDEGSLGRQVGEEEECFIPGKVELEQKVVQITAGDSHTAALTEEGEVWLWGTFRDSSGPIGLVSWSKIEMLPVRVEMERRHQVVRIASGGDHLALLTRAGELLTMGNSEQGQLGRVPEMFAHRGGRRGGALLLTPDTVHNRSKTPFTQVWAGSYNTVAVTRAGEVLVMGLNNYSQMGVDHTTKESLTFFMPELSPDLSKKVWTDLCVGQHHTLGLDSEGGVFCLGRSEYGRLGLGQESGDAKVATAVPVGGGKAGSLVACGTAVSYAVVAGDCYSWGMGTNGQLGTGEEDDAWSPVLVRSKQLTEGREVLSVSSGGQHTAMIVRDRQAGETME